MAGRVVDLTLSSDSDAEPARKRARRQPAAIGPSSNNSDVEVLSSESDVEVVVPRRRSVSQAQDNNIDLGDEDLVITNTTGQVATRDLPHPRPDCDEHRMATGTSTANASFCQQCYCYVCDVKASECRFWGTGARERDHASAKPTGYWRRLREAARAGNRGLVNAEYHASGPLGNTLTTARQLQARLPYPSFTVQPRAASLVEPAAAAAACVGASGSGRPAEEAQNPRPTSGTEISVVLSVRMPAPSVAVAALPAPAAAAPGQAMPQADASISKLPSGHCKLKRLSNPASERFSFELGVLRFDVKAAQGLTIAAISDRLERFGFYYQLGTKEEDSGDRLSLANLFKTRGGIRNGVYKEKPLYLKMLPLPTPPEEAAPVSDHRVRKVLVVDCQGRSRATVMGVPVTVSAKRADLLAALVPLLQPPFSPDTELLHLAQGSIEGDIRLVDVERTLDDDVFDIYNCAPPRGAHILAFRTALHPAPTWTVPNTRSAPPPVVGQKPVYAHRDAHAAWVVMHIRQERETPGGMGETTNRLGIPVLLPLRSGHAKGGRTAVDALHGALQTALKAYRTPQYVNGSSVNPVCVLRGHSVYQWDRSGSVPARYRFDAPGDTLGHSSNNYLPQLTAVMRQELPASAFKLAEMPTPAVDASASPELLRESEAFRAAAKRKQKAERRRKTAPMDCILELQRAMQRPHPEDKITAMQTISSAALDVTLEPSSRPGADPREGELLIKVYVWAVHGPGKAVLLEPWDEWHALGKRDRDVLFPLSTTLELLSTGITDPSERHLPGAHMAAGAAVGGTAAGPSSASHNTRGGGGSSSAAGGVALPAVLAEVLQRRARAERARAREMWAAKRELADVRPDRSINALLDFMQSGERPAAPQPPGLTVTMRPYQLQSLKFMLDLERLVDLPGASGSGGGGGDGSVPGAGHESSDGDDDGDGSDYEGDAGPSTSSAAAARRRAQQKRTQQRRRKQHQQQQQQQQQPQEVLDAADPDAADGGCPGGYRRLFWLPLSNSTGERYWYSPVLSRLSRKVPVQPIGGFLAEEMGLGKTVEVMALTLANPASRSVVSAPCGRILSRATLVVCAVSLVGQWQAEAASKTTEDCRIHPYHGPCRIRDPMRLATEFDVVVTTYQTLQSDHSTPSSPNPCQAIKWHRIVFDEGHMLRSANAKLYKTAVELTSDRKWLCTGTPINNAVDDLIGQFGAIHLYPYGKKTFFDSYIKGPFMGSSRHLQSIAPLLYALRHTMIRHTKAQNLGGQGVLQLPPKVETDVPVLLSPEEQALYKKVHKEATREWQRLKGCGPAYVNSHLFTAISLLVPLRRICSGGHLRPQDVAVPDPQRLAGAAGAAAGGAGGGAAAGVPLPVPDDMTECPICVDTMEQPVVTACNHWFCRECITGWINTSAHHNCPACRNPVTVASLRAGIMAPPPAEAGASVEEAAAAGAGAPPGTVPCESKLLALLSELRAMREADPTAKALVFTQFGQTLEWLKPRLMAEGFGHRTITGDMTQRKRTEAIESFQHNPATNVFLLSVRSGAVGINLTAANYVYLLEPCMNPAMEEQAIGRSWRMGQQRPVVVKRLYVKGSVEEKIMEVVKTRRSGAAGGAGGNGGSSGGGAMHSPGGRSAVVAVAGSLRQDKTDLRINELELMFSNPQFPSPGGAGR